MIKLLDTKKVLAIAVIGIGTLLGLGTNVRAATNDLSAIKQEVYNKTGLQEQYIDIIYELGVNNTEYSDRFPSLTKDTVKKSSGPIMNLSKNTKYQILKSVKTVGIKRPSEYYMPDALYSEAYDIKTLMQYRYYSNRGEYQRYFDSFNEDIKQSIVFCEAMLLYTGETEENTNKLCKAYEMFILNYVGSMAESLQTVGFTDEKSINTVESIINLDNTLSSYSDLKSTKQTYEMPYIVGYTSRENLLESAFSLVGKVRYTWAGGHAKTSNIKGINPVWVKWESLYPKSQTTEDGSVVDGYGFCIKPSGSWCPIHGYNEDDRCIQHDLVSSYNDYLKLRAETLNDDTLFQDKYKGMLNYIDPEDGTAHRLDGLDCSGYASWIYNQISNKYSIDSSAMYFTRQQGITSVAFGSEMLPGDVFAWTSHIVVIVGKVSENSKVYVTVEQTPNVLKFGTVYYSGCKQSDLEEGIRIAREANALIGNTTEEPHSYCMNNVGYYSVELGEEQDISSVLGSVKSVETKEQPIDDSSESEDSDIDMGDSYEDSSYSEEYSDEETNDESDTPTQTITTVKAQYIDIGRFEGSFLDDEIVIEFNQKTLKDSTAYEIIQYIITRLPLEYISGYSTYSGELFDKSTVATNVGTHIIKE